MANTGAYENNLSGCFYEITNTFDSPNGSNRHPKGVGFAASRSSPIFGKSSTVTPLTITVRYLIKY